MGLPQKQDEGLHFDMCLGTSTCQPMHKDTWTSGIRTQTLPSSPLSYVSPSLNCSPTQGTQALDLNTKPNNIKSAYSSTYWLAQAYPPSSLPQPHNTLRLTVVCLNCEQSQGSSLSSVWGCNTGPELLQKHVVQHVVHIDIDFIMAQFPPPPSSMGLAP